jgi:preprotein translocase subunit SecB
MDPTKQPGLEIGQIVLERVLFEHRPDYLTVPHTTPVPTLPLRIHAHLGLDQEKRTGVVRVTLDTDREQQPLYVIEITLAALVLVKKGEENMSIEQYAMTACIATLFPFLREAVANLTSRGRFGPIWLHPFNVKAEIAGVGVRVTAGASGAGQ